MGRKIYRVLDPKKHGYARGGKRKLIVHIPSGHVLGDTSKARRAMRKDWRDYLRQRKEWRKK